MLPFLRGRRTKKALWKDNTDKHADRTEDGKGNCHPAIKLMHMACHILESFLHEKMPDPDTFWVAILQFLRLNRAKEDFFSMFSVLLFES